MATTTIAKTLLATSDPLSLPQGLPLFPPFPDIGLAANFNGGACALIHKGVKILAFKAQAGIDYGAFFGLAGPGYAIKFYVEGEAEDQQLTLRVDDDDALGGLMFGTNVSLSFNLVAQVYKLHWKGWRLRGSWDAVLNAELAISFDFLKVAVDIILAALELESLFQEVEPLKETLTSSFAFMGSNSNSYVSHDGVIDLVPKLMIPFNLWSIVVAAAYAGTLTEVLAPITAPIIAFDKLLNVTCSSIGCGPTFGISVPVAIEIDSVKLDEATYYKTDITADGHWQGATGDQAPDDPKEITVTLANTNGFDFRVGVYAEVQILELFHAGASMDMGLLGLLDIVPQGGPFYNNLKNDIGSQYAADHSIKPAGQAVEVEFA